MERSVKGWFILAILCMAVLSGSFTQGARDVPKKGEIYKPDGLLGAGLGLALAIPGTLLTALGWPLYGLGLGWGGPGWLWGLSHPEQEGESETKNGAGFAYGVPHKGGYVSGVGAGVPEANGHANNQAP